MINHLKRIIKGSIIYGIGIFLTQSINILLLPLFTTYLTPNDYGVISLLLLLFLFLTQIFSLGAGVALGICYFEKKEKETKNLVVGNAFIILIISSLIMFFLGAALVKQINHLLFPSGEYQNLIRLIILSAIPIILVLPFVLKLQFEEKHKIFVTTTLLSTILSIGIKLILVIILHRGAQGMIEGILFGNILTLLLFILPQIRKIKLQINLNLSKKLIRLGLPMIPSFLALYILQQGNIYFLSRSEGSLNLTGLYSIGFAFGGTMLSIVSAFTTAWFPFFMSFTDKREEARILFGHITRYYIFGMGLISLLFFVFAKPIVIIFTQPAFYGSYKVIGLIAAAHFTIGIFNTLLPPIYFAKEVKYVTAIQITAAILFIGMSFYMVNISGIIGAGISLIFGYGLMSAALYLWNQIHKTKYFNIQYEWKRIGLFIGMYILSLFLIMWEKNINFSVELTTSILLFMELTFVVYLLLHRQEKEILLNILKYCWRWQRNKIKFLYPF